ncbi:unnamed protein product [Rotaria sordida]|uniref:G-protein coupled receptors family 1 profile domain-containing protein n=1 Tax=Rotaria sordida TaxID=392033 RepID=A0A814PR07_9BILA|nr:unnamed protein product [Rotaria sordida]CAF4038724.1 unnamed protein product [Rotaria sordida]
MSQSIISTADLISHRVTIYLGIPIFFLGMIGGFLNIIVFLSLKTFRNSSCAFYLTVMAMVSIGYLFSGLLTFIMMYGFGIDWTKQSRSYCIFREGFVHICILIAFTCLCLATIDQFLATCSSPRWQQLCNIKLARRLCITFVILWFLYGILFFTSYDLIIDSSTGNIDCMVINQTFQQYFKIWHVLIFLGVLPISVTVLFGCLAYRNVQRLSYRTLPLVRRELDKQLTLMVLMHIVFNFCALMPYLVINVVILHPYMTQNPVANAISACIRILSIILFYSCFACPFYIYICASERFRHQLVFVLYKIHLQRWRRRNVVIDLVIPQQ